jgi:hypothetical protein
MAALLVTLAVLGVAGLAYVAGGVLADRAAEAEWAGVQRAWDQQGRELLERRRR